MDQASPTYPAALLHGQHGPERHNAVDDRLGSQAAELDDGDASDSEPGSEFIEALLAALTDMAVRSPRRQADLGVALRRSGIEAAPATMLRALRLLEEDGCIEHLVPLTDGGLLMQVTAHGIERLSQTSRRHVLDFSGK